MLQPGWRPATVLAGDFDSWLAAREPALQRVAALLGGDAAAGRALIRPVLVRVCAEWARLGAEEADDRARELLLAEHRCTWGTGAAEPSAVPLTGYDDPALAAWTLVATVSPRLRAVVVLLYHEHVAETDAARLLRLTVATLRGDERAVLDALEDHLAGLRETDPSRALPSAERLLTDTLDEHGEQAAYLPTPADEVHATAERVRARRRLRTVVTIGAVVAALVVALAAAAALVGPPEPTRRPASSEPRAPFGPLGSFERGDPPGIPFLVENVLHDPGGSRLDLPVDHPRSATPFRGHLWVTELYFEVTDTLHRIDASGREVGSWPTAGDPVVSHDGSTFAWVEAAHGRTRGSVIHLNGRRLETFQRVLVVGLIGDRVVYNGALGGLDQVWVTDLRTPARRVPGMRIAVAAEPNEGLVSGFDRDGNGVVLDIDSGRVLWRSANWRPTAFSPDGQHVIAYGATRSRVVNAVLSADSGELVVPIDWTLPAPWVLDARWEDDEHVLLLAVDQGESAILRAGLDGTIVRASPPMAADEVGASRYRFAAR